MIISAAQWQGELQRLCKSLSASFGDNKDDFDDFEFERSLYYIAICLRKLNDTSLKPRGFDFCGWQFGGNYYAPRESMPTIPWWFSVDANFEMRITVDILLVDEVTQSPVAVLDTKYKVAEHPHESDIHQIGFYAHEIGVRHALLVYPSPVGVPLRKSRQRRAAWKPCFRYRSTAERGRRGLSRFPDQGDGLLKRVDRHQLAARARMARNSRSQTLPPKPVLSSRNER